jgi:TonB family protein
MSASSATMTRASGFAQAADGAPAPERPRSVYRVDGRPMRPGALVATVLLHLAIGAVLAIGWQRAETTRSPAHLTSVTLPPHTADEPRRRPVSGTQAPTRRPEPLPFEQSPLPPILLAPPAPVASEAITEHPAPTEGGQADTLVIATQTYRRAIMERLEAQGREVQKAMPDSANGAGAVLFRIERSGALLEASLARSTGRRALDRAAVSIVRRAAPFPPIPDALPDELAITVPVEFVLHRHAPEVAAR